jgi:hypothetical protein
MNKKFSVLLFAIGLGATSAWAQVEQEPCGAFCMRMYHECMASGAATGECVMDRIDCTDRCGI